MFVQSRWLGLSIIEGFTDFPGDHIVQVAVNFCFW